MAITEEWKEQLKNSNEIVSVISKYITLQKKGKTWWGCCPFHYEKTSSFAVRENEQYYHCFGCGVGGDVIKFIEKIENVDFYDACKILAKNANMQMPELDDNANIQKQKKEKEQIYNALKDAANYYYNNLKLPEAKIALEYLAKRRLNNSTITAFGLGYSVGWNEVITHLNAKGYDNKLLLKAGIAEEKNGKYFDCYAKRLIFPIINNFNNVVGFSARLLEDAKFAKYKNTAATIVFDKSKCVYGIHNLKKLKNDTGLNNAILVEGQMDVISLYQNGVTNAVASQGTALTSFHAKEIKKYCEKVTVCFDGDEAGKKATLRSIDILLTAGLEVFIASLPKGFDPDDFIKKYSKMEFDKLISEAKYWVEFLIIDLSKEYNLSKANEKASFIANALNIVNKLKSKAEQDIYLNLIKEISNISLDVLRADLNKNDSVNAIEEVKKKELVLSTENAYVKAVKFIIASLIHKKTYATLDENIKQNLLNPEYLKIYEYCETCALKKTKPIISHLFDMFDVENNQDINDVINYEFVPNSENERYYKECIKLIIIINLKTEQAKLTEEFAKTKDIDERVKIAARLNELIKLIKQQN